jgi:O-antigen/teichoic acid export membrane protein
MVALVLIADPLSKLIHDQQGQSYAVAALLIKILAAAAMLRVTAQVLYPLVIGSGRPGMAARLSAITLILLSVGILTVGFTFNADTGIVAAALVWLCIYPPLLAWEASYVRRHWNVPARDLVRIFTVPAAGVAVLIAFVEATRMLNIATDPRFQIGIVAAATALTYGTFLLYARCNTPRALTVNQQPEEREVPSLP